MQKIRIIISTFPPLDKVSPDWRFRVGWGGEPAPGDRSIMRQDAGLMHVPHASIICGVRSVFTALLIVFSGHYLRRPAPARSCRARASQVGEARSPGQDGGEDPAAPCSISTRRTGPGKAAPAARYRLTAPALGRRAAPSAASCSSTPVSVRG